MIMRSVQALEYVVPRHAELFDEDRAEHDENSAESDIRQLDGMDNSSPTVCVASRPACPSQMTHKGASRHCMTALAFVQLLVPRGVRQELDARCPRIWTDERQRIWNDAQKAARKILDEDAAEAQNRA